MTIPKRQICYIVPNGFPDSATGKRVIGIGKALRLAGINPTFIVEDAYVDASRKEFYRENRYQDFRIIKLGHKGTKTQTLRSHLSRYINYGKRAQIWLEKQNKTNLDAIILYNPVVPHHLHIRRLCSRYGIPLVIDITEWHDSQNYPGLRYLAHRIDSQLGMRFFNARVRNIIAISSYLETFLRKRGRNVICVPPLIDMSEPIWKRRSVGNRTSSTIRVMYAGHAGKKDALGNILDAVWTLSQEGFPVILELCGMHEEEIQATGRLEVIRLGQLRGFIKVHGFLPTIEQVADRISTADLLLVIKNETKASRYQFPTKLVEYMALAKPVLVNITSDIHKYVRDGIEGVVIPDSNPCSIAGGIRRAYYDLDRLDEMGRNSLLMAQKCFDYRAYGELMSDFFACVRQENKGQCS